MAHRTERTPLVVVLHCRVDGPGIDDPAALLNEALAGEASAVVGSASPAGIAAVLDAALSSKGARARGLPGRGSALEWNGRHWRLLSHNAVDPLHGVGGDEGIGRPAQ